MIGAHCTTAYLNNIYVVHGENGLAKQCEELFDDALHCPAVMDGRALLSPVVGLDDNFCIDEAVVTTCCSRSTFVGRQEKSVNGLI